MDNACIVKLILVMLSPVKGLGLIPGVVGRFDPSNGLRVPHIGWNAIKVTKDSHILDEIESRHVYFVHSYRATPVIYLNSSLLMISHFLCS